MINGKVDYLITLKSNDFKNMNYFFVFLFLISQFEF